MKESIKVLIVEDDDDFAYLLQKELGRQERIVLVGICREKEEAITQTEALRPDIVLMDLHLGSSYSDGIEASRRIRCGGRPCDRAGEDSGTGVPFLPFGCGENGFLYDAWKGRTSAVV